MAFNNIDAPGLGNRRDRRVVAAIQRKHGAAGRLEAAKQKRMRKAAKAFENDLKRTIVFFALPDGGVRLDDPEGAYIKQSDLKDGYYQVVVVGEMKASVKHYVRAISAFIKTEVKLVSDELLPVVYPDDGKVRIERPFRSIIVKVI